MITTVRNKKTRKVESAMEAYGCREDGHECHSCGAEMGINCSTRGNYFAKLFPGREHGPGCLCVGLENTKKLIAVEEIEPDLVFDSISKPRKRHGGGGGGKHPGTPRPETERKSTIGGLEEIMVLGLHNAADFRLSAGVYVHDLVINSSTIRAVDVAGEDLGRRVIYATPVGYQGPPYRRLTFAIFYGDGNSLAKCIFDLVLASDREYWEQFTRLFERKPRSDRSRKKYRSRYNRVLLYGEWSNTPRPMCGENCREKCKEKWTCRAYQHSVCPYPSQHIFCHPTDMITQDGKKMAKKVRD